MTAPAAYAALLRAHVQRGSRLGETVERRPLPGPPQGRTRGAAAATSGSKKCAASCASHRSEGTQSLSRKATSSLSTWRSPALRAAPGPAERSWRTTVARRKAAAAATEAGSREPSSTTTIETPGSSAARHRASVRGRSRTGIRTVTSGWSCGRGCGGRGCASPASTSLRPRRRAATEESGPAWSAARAARPSAVSVITRGGRPPARTRPSRKRRTEPSRTRRNPGGSGITGTGPRRPGSPRRSRRCSPGPPASRSAPRPPRVR